MGHWIRSFSFLSLSLSVDCFLQGDLLGEIFLHANGLRKMPAVAALSFVTIRREEFRLNGFFFLLANLQKKELNYPSSPVCFTALISAKATARKRKKQNWANTEKNGWEKEVALTLEIYSSSKPTSHCCPFFLFLSLSLSLLLSLSFCFSLSLVFQQFFSRFPPSHHFDTDPKTRKGQPSIYQV